MRETTAIAMSGGVDSLVAAALLKERGHSLRALHFITGYEAGPPLDGADSQGSWLQLHDQAHHRMQPLADALDIPLYIIDLRREFKNLVVDYFVSTYQNGRTPNPCLVCNSAIKFDALLKRAQDLGATRIATGHYARNIVRDDGRRHLLRAADPDKDQSYFLARLTQAQLALAVFPLAELTKSQTRQIAADRGLQPASAAESQDICFIKNARYGDFLSRQPGFKWHQGPIEDVQGRTIGSHKGLHYFTIGQRKGIDCPAARPYYVVKLDAPRNCLVVGQKEDVFTDQCQVSQINWIIQPPKAPLEVFVRVRYRHKAVAATLTPLEQTSALVRFDKPEPAVTPGQGAVFYLGDEVLGGGWIQ
jgi:tRNA-specific 2-thiouridylase